MNGYEFFKKLCILCVLHMEEDKYVHGDSIMTSWRFQPYEHIRNCRDCLLLMAQIFS